MKLKLDYSVDTHHVFHGSSVVYCVEGNKLTALPADYEIDLDYETFPDQFRAARLKAKKKNKLKKLPPAAVGEGLLVVLGSDASPKYAADALRSLAKRIEESGLLIGPEKQDGDRLFEDFKTGNVKLF